MCFLRWLVTLFEKPMDSLSGHAVFLSIILIIGFSFCEISIASVPASGLAIPKKYIKTYASNKIHFSRPLQNKCVPTNGDSDSDSDVNPNGDSFKVNPDTPPYGSDEGGFWYLENTWTKYPKTRIYNHNPAVQKDTKIDSDFFDMPYIYAENYDFDNTVLWANGGPVKVTPNGKKSTRKYYWLVLPGEAYTSNMGDKYVAYFEKRKEPVYFIMFDTWACEHQKDPKYSDTPYCKWAEEDPNNVNGGVGKHTLGHFSERGSTANRQLGDALGKLTCLHRINTDNAPTAHESAACKGKSGSSDDEDEGGGGDSGDEDVDEDGGGKSKTDSSDTGLHKPKNKWLDKAGLEGFKKDKALNSEADDWHVDTNAMKSGKDDYTSFADDAGNGAGLPGFIVLHWTAVNGGNYSWKSFGDSAKKVYYPPHFTIDVVKKTILQHFPLSSPSGAVAGDWDRYGIQIEVVGSPYDSCGGRADSKYNIYKFTDDQYDYLAKLLIAISKETGIPLESSLKWASGEGSDVAPKLSEKEVKKYIGVLGHEHLPNQAGKFDPGKMWEYVEKALGRLGYEYDSDGGGEGSGDDEERSGEGGEEGGEEECPGGTGEDSDCGNGGGIAAVARKLAWKDDNHARDIHPEYAKAAKEVGIPSAATEWSGWSGGAADCGRFVAVVVRKAVDPNFPECCTGPIQAYMTNSSLWEEIPNNGSEDNMKPGDVLVVNSGSGEGGNGHVYIYLGNGEQASASLDGYTGKIKKGVTFADSRGTYHIFRYVGSGGGAKVADVAKNGGGDEKDSNNKSTSGSKDKEDNNDSDEETEEEEDDNGCSDELTGDFDEDLKALEKDDIKVGVAVSATNNKKADEVQTGGSYKGARAWSTIKVPLAIAALQEDVSTDSVKDPYGDTCSHTLDSAVKAAISKSDNCAAWWLWVALGGDNSSAASKVEGVLSSGGDSSTSVVSSGDGKSLTSGKTEWTLVNQAIFAANMDSISKSSSVLSAMKNDKASDGSHGLSANFTSMIKGGWGAVDGAATRQFGIIKLSKGKCSAVAIGTNQGSNFSLLDKITKVLMNYKDDLPSGDCPKGL